MSQPNLAWLFATQALKIAPADQPFWYTSGLIGPYYINTQFLCGGEAKAKEVLDLIEQKQYDHDKFHAILMTKLREIYQSHAIYRQTIDLMVQQVQTDFPFDQIDYISGGQRRDWFFAPLVAELTHKPLLYVYNDQSIYLADGTPAFDLKSAQVINVADLLTVASSYIDKWIPALAHSNAKLLWSLTGVDRKQGGEQILLDAGLTIVKSLFSIDLKLFEQALELEYIDQAQFELVKGFIQDPHGSMRSFIQSHPDFLEAALNSPDPKTKQRAEKQAAEDLYGLSQR